MEAAGKLVEGVVELQAEGLGVAAVERRQERAVVFLHGWLMSPQIWSAAMDRLDGRIRVLALWQPGHGPSHAPAADFTMEDWVDWLLASLEGLGIRRAVLVGHSMGGFLVQAAARARPEIIDGLVIVGSQDTVWSKERNAEFRQVVASLPASWGRDAAAMTAERLLGARFLHQHRGWLADWEAEVGTFDLLGMAGLANAITTRFDFSCAVGPDVPTLVTHGSADVAIPVEDGRALADRIVGARFVEFAGSGHCPPLEAPEEFAEILDAFLAKTGLIEPRAGQ